MSLHTFLMVSGMLFTLLLFAAFVFTVSLAVALMVYEESRSRIAAFLTFFIMAFAIVSMTYASGEKHKADVRIEIAGGAA